METSIWHEAGGSLEVGWPASEVAGSQRPPDKGGRRAEWGDKKASFPSSPLDSVELDEVGK